MFLGIDFGKKRIGLALGQIIPKGAGVIDGEKSIDEIILAIQKICEENEVTDIVIGWPQKPSGTDGELTGDIKEFGDKLGAVIGLPVHYEEEALTSVAAEQILQDIGQKYDRKGGKKDELAAILILEQYINNIDKSKMGK